MDHKTDSNTQQQRSRKWLNSTVLGIGLASFCSDVGHEMATVAMPALIASLGGSSAVLGLIEGLADGFSSFAKLLSGHFSDRLKKRKWIAVIGYFATASGMASFAIATQTWHVLVGRVGGWLGRGVRTPIRNTLLTEATTAENYGKVFGLERAMDSAGAVAGPLIAALVISHFGIRSVFALTLIPGIAAGFLIATLVRENPHRERAHGPLLSGFRRFPKTYRRFLVGVGIDGMGDFSNTLLILWATQSWTPYVGRVQAAAWAIMFYVGYNVVYTMSCAWVGRLADKYPKSHVLAFGYMLAVIPAIALLTPGASFLKFAVIFGFSGLYMGFEETVEASTAASLLPSEVRGLGFGTLATINGIGDLVSSALVGLLWVISPHLAMSWVIATSLIGAWLVWRSGQEPAEIPTG
jgi:MFS family permease